MRIAMWSGPRNLSTAMMYAFGNRADCAVVDEPFYASYLAKTGLQHPMWQEILDSQSHDPAVVVEQITGSNPGAKPYFYQKHMTQHMIAGVPRDWMRAVKNVFLIRHPARVISSYAAKREDPTLDDIGFWQQSELFGEVTAWGGKPIVVDSHDIRENPAMMLEKLCDAIDMPFSAQMLTWPKGGHKDDGAWARHWYGSVWTSNGFAGAEAALPEVPEHLQDLLDAAMPHYQRMKSERL